MHGVPEKLDRIPHVNDQHIADIKRLRSGMQMRGMITDFVATKNCSNDVYIFFKNCKTHPKLNLFS